MSTLNASVAFADLEVPVGFAVASYEAALSDGQVAAFTLEAPEVAFAVEVAGVYTVTVRAFTADGTQVGAAVVSNEVEVVVAPTTIIVKVPASVALTLGA